MEADVSKPVPLAVERLRAFLARHGVPIGPVVVADGRLTIRLLRAGERFEVHLGPRGATTPYHAIGPYALGYRGVATLDGEAQAWMDLIVATLARIGRSLPALLAHPAAAGVDALPLAEALPLEFPFCSVEVTDDVDGSGPRIELLVRMTTRCNQVCPFCSAPPPLADPVEGEVRRLLERVATTGHRGLVTFTGGEPTLRPELPALVAHALRGPDRLHTHVQTNAVFFANPSRLAAFPPPSPRLGFFISLHAVEGSRYDLCTGTRGQLARAIAGVQNLLAAGHEVLLNCVVNRFNVDHLVDWVEAIPRLFTERRPLLHFSVTMCPEHRPGAPDVLVRYREVAARLEEAIARAQALALPHDALQSSTHASIPACLVSPDLREDVTHRPRIAAHETGYEDSERLWMKAERCRTCRMNPWCLGLPRPYALRFGLDELSPI